jgi:glycosyltransferase involved in cell wall biosynthesis
MKSLTVFTPTYNRAYCLSKLYESLKAQSNNDFVWLIVDDGSTDNTEELVKNFIDEKFIDIRYHKKENGGKHTAHNVGVELCETDLFVCVDSDDYLVNDAVRIMNEIHNEHKKENLLGYYFRRKYPDGSNVASDYPKRIVRAGIVDLYNKYAFRGDTVIVLKSKYAKQCSFPTFSGERFVTERVYYNQLNSIAPMLLREEAIYVCEYLEDGYTKNARRLTAKNPYGSALAQLSEAYYAYGIINRVKHYAQYLSLVKVYDLDKGVLITYDKASFITKALSRLILWHYIPLYKKLKEEFKIINEFKG